MFTMNRMKEQLEETRYNVEQEFLHHTAISRLEGWVMVFGRLKNLSQGQVEAWTEQLEKDQILGRVRSFADLARDAGIIKTPRQSVMDYFTMTYNPLRKNIDLVPGSFHPAVEIITRGSEPLLDLYRLGFVGELVIKNESAENQQNTSFHLSA